MNEPTATFARCPQCGRPASRQHDNPFRPFCSRRCKTIDLGAWISGDYTVCAVEEEPLSDDIHRPS